MTGGTRKISGYGQLRLPLGVRARWGLGRGASVDISYLNEEDPALVIIPEGQAQAMVSFIAAIMDVEPPTIDIQGRNNDRRGRDVKDIFFRRKIVGGQHITVPNAIRRDLDNYGDVGVEVEDLNTALVVVREHETVERLAQLVPTQVLRSGVWQRSGAIQAAVGLTGGDLPDAHQDGAEQPIDADEVLATALGRKIGRFLWGIAPTE